MRDFFLSRSWLWVGAYSSECTTENSNLLLLPFDFHIMASLGPTPEHPRRTDPHLIFRSPACLKGQAREFWNITKEISYERI